MVTVMRPGCYFVCGGGSLCWSVRVGLLLGVGAGAGFTGAWSLWGCQRLNYNVIACYFLSILTPILLMILTVTYP